MTRKSRTTDEALAEEAARLKSSGVVPDVTEPEALESAVLSEAAATIVEEPPPAPEAPPVEELTFVPPEPVWTPSESVVPPHWVVAAQRRAWKCDAAEAKQAFGGELPKDGETARWTGGDVDYRYFRGGKVLATFRTGDLFGVLRTNPVAEFDAEPPAPEPVA